MKICLKQKIMYPKLMSVLYSTYFYIKIIEKTCFINSIVHNTHNSYN